MREHSLFIVIISSLVVFATRALPFFMFKGKAVVSPFVAYIGKVLPGAVIAVLVIYCLRDVEFISPAGFVPALISVAAVAILHKWRRNNLLSIGGGTALYMLMVQAIFK